MDRVSLAGVIWPPGQPMAGPGQDKEAAESLQLSHPCLHRPGETQASSARGQASQGAEGILLRVWGGQWPPGLYPRHINLDTNTHKVFLFLASQGGLGVCWLTSEPTMNLGYMELLLIPHRHTTSLGLPNRVDPMLHVN